MKTFTSILLLYLGILNYASTQTIIIDDDTQPFDCTELKSLLSANGEGVICFINGTLRPIRLRLVINCDNILIGQDKEIKIPSNFTLQLREGNDFTLTGNGTITGEHFASSTIDIGPDTDDPAVSDERTAVNMIGCNGCSVSNISIRGNNEDDDTGIKISANSSNNEISAVNFENVNEGIIVNGDGNIFNDLDFFKTAIGDNNCNPADNDFAAIILNESNNNTFTNVLHTRSKAAVTFRFEGQCNDNSLYNISVEQEDSDCPDFEPNGLDPCIWIRDITCTGNFITTNLNHGRVIPGETGTDETTLCQTNSISAFRNTCNGASECTNIE